MTRILHILSVVLSWLSTFFPKSHAIHRADYAPPHKLRHLLSHTFAETALLLGIPHLGGIFLVRSTPERRELGNVLVDAPTRGGKGLLAVSQLLTWPSSVIVLDIKGELYKQTSGYRTTFSDVYHFDTRGNGDPYDPLHACVDEDDLYAAAKNLLYEPREADGKSFTEKGIKLLKLLWAAALELNRLTGEQHRLLPFTRTMANLGGLNCVAPAIYAISPTIARQLLDGEYDPEIDYNERKYVANSYDSLTARLLPILTDRISRCFNGSAFTGKDIIAGKRPVSVYLCIPEKDLLAKAGVIRLVVQSLISEMNDTYDDAEGRNCRPVLLLLDEAGTVGIHGLHQYAATGAGRGISLWVAVQDLAQLDGQYGPYYARTIRNNMDSKIFYRQADYDTAAAISRALGERSEYAHSQTLHNGQAASEGLVE
jgi:type IV secretion system protein VirD4